MRGKSLRGLSGVEFGGCGKTSSAGATHWRKGRLLTGRMIENASASTSLRRHKTAPQVATRGIYRPPWRTDFPSITVKSTAAIRLLFALCILVVSASAQVDTLPLRQTLNNPSPQDFDQFGYSVAISGTRVVVGASSTTRAQSMPAAPTCMTLAARRRRCPWRRSTTPARQRMTSSASRWRSPARGSGGGRRGRHGRDRRGERLCV